MRRMRLLRLTDSKIGPKSATSDSRVRYRRSMLRQASSDIRTSTTTEDGKWSPPTAPSGSRPASQSAGLPTGSGAGFGSLLGAGPGSIPHRGALRRSIMVDGCPSAVPGAGLRVLCSLVGVRFMRLPLWAGWVAQDGGSASRSESDSDSAEGADGSPWDGVNLS